MAVDDEWNTLNQFWLHRVPDAGYTSVSFLIDRKGIIRYIHPGGAYTQKEANTLKQKIEALLGETGAN